MITTVTLNAALDVTYSAARLSSGDPVRVDVVSARAGGKGLNVAFILKAFGCEVAATGFAGGGRGAAIRRQVSAAGIADNFSGIGAESRQTVTIVAEDGSVAAYDERGPIVTAAEWEECLGLCASAFAGATDVVLAGSVPPGVPEDAYAVLAGLGRAGGARLVLDAAGPFLAKGAAAAPDLLKLNRAELEGLAGRALDDEAAVVDAARELHQRTGAGCVVATMGASGACLVSEGVVLLARPPLRRGNPIGAGDAFTAAWVAHPGAALEDRLLVATAAATAAVEAPVAGVIDIAAARRLEASVTVEEA